MKKKYRIVLHWVMETGRPKYRIQRRSLFVWFNCSKGMELSTAEMAIKEMKLNDAKLAYEKAPYKPQSH